MKIIELFKGLGIDAYLLICGVFGALIYSTRSEKKGFIQTFIDVLTGAITTAYLSPIVISYLNLGEKSKYAVAFFIGLVAILIIDTVIEQAKKLKKDPSSVINLIIKKFKK